MFKVLELNIIYVDNTRLVSMLGGFGVCLRDIRYAVFMLISRRAIIHMVILERKQQHEPLHVLRITPLYCL